MTNVKSLQAWYSFYAVKTAGVNCSAICKLNYILAWISSFFFGLRYWISLWNAHFFLIVPFQQNSKGQTYLFYTFPFLLNLSPSRENSFYIKGSKPLCWSDFVLILKEQWCSQKGEQMQHKLLNYRFPFWKLCCYNRFYPNAMHCTCTFKVNSLLKPMLVRYILLGFIHFIIAPPPPILEDNSILLQYM